MEALHDRAPAGGGARPAAPEACAISRIFTSPLERTRETADIIGRMLSVVVEVCEAVTETAVGTGWEGRRWSQIRSARRAEWETYRQRPDEVDFMDETFTDVGERVASAIRGIAEDHPGEGVVVVSHGDPIRAGTLVLTGGSIRDLHRRTLPPCGVVILDVDTSGGAREVDPASLSAW